MVICILISGIIGLLSIFSFFGHAFSNTGGKIIPNMFDLMFGSGNKYENYYIEWNQYGGLTFLFVLQILIMVASIVGFVIVYNIKVKDGEKQFGVILSIVMSIMSIVASIISSFTLDITDINQNGRYDVNLGFGPVFYSILNIIIALILIYGVVLYYKEPSNVNRRVHYYRPVTSSASHEGNTPAKPVLSENEKADLILKYKKMFDDNIISKEEFEKKKKDLLGID